MDAPGRLIGSGRCADVYDIGQGRVLRRYRDAAATTGREAEVMTHARAHGVPVPEVFDASGADLVMALAAGPTTGTAALAGQSGSFLPAGELIGLTGSFAGSVAVLATGLAAALALVATCCPEPAGRDLDDPVRPAA